MQVPQALCQSQTTFVLARKLPTWFRPNMACKKSMTENKRKGRQLNNSSRTQEPPLTDPRAVDSTQVKTANRGRGSNRHARSWRCRTEWSTSQRCDRMRYTSPPIGKLIRIKRYPIGLGSSLIDTGAKSGTAQMAPIKPNSAKLEQLRN